MQEHHKHRKLDGVRLSVVLNDQMMRSLESNQKNYEHADRSDEEIFTLHPSFINTQF